jgi:hypothetical protein
VVVAPVPGHRRAGAPGLVRRGRPSGGCRVDDLGDTWQADVFAVPSVVSAEDTWAATLEAAAGHRCEALQVLVLGDTAPRGGLAIQSGFVGGVKSPV